MLYAASGGAKEADKARIARALLQNLNFVTSVHVLQEFYVNAAGKLSKNIAPEQLDIVLHLLRQQPVAPITLGIFDTAVALSRRYQLSHYDGVAVVNPFV